MNEPLEAKHASGENMFEENKPTTPTAEDNKISEETVNNNSDSTVKESSPETVPPSVESPSEEKVDPVSEGVVEKKENSSKKDESEILTGGSSENTSTEEKNEIDGSFSEPALSSVEVLSEEKDVPVSEEVVEEKENDLKGDEPEIPAEVSTENILPEEKNTSSGTQLTQEDADKLSNPEILEKMEGIVGLSFSDHLKTEMDLLKQSFYKHKKIDLEKAKKAFVAEGKDENDFVAPEDPLEERLKELLQQFKEKKTAWVADSEKIKEQNLAAKKEILQKIEKLIDSQDDFYKVYNEFRKLQQEWKEIKLIPQESVSDLWKEYQVYSEKFYDLLKINNEMRDYDFKKNLELKTALCESVEKLEAEPDVISAFYQLQKFHQEWREIGPVAREYREEIWNRFKQASTVINKRHQEHFENLRNLEQRNLEEKTAICEEMEAIDYNTLVTFKDWDEKNKRVLELQETWKTIGFAPKKYNVKIFERFRAACDVFFQKKSEFYKVIKEAAEVNLEKKKSLCEQAEALKDSQDWREATNKFVELQKEWKTIGPVSRKHSDAIWKRFISACDYFFEQKNKHFSSQRTEEVENLKLKKELIEKINALDTSLPSQEAISLLREMMSEWNNIGFVPFKEKDKIYKEYKTAVDKHFDRLKVDESERRLQSFKSNLSELASSDRPKNKLLSEREKLMRTYERLKNDIQTYENNIGFLSVSSKGGGGLLKEMNRKIESLKEELNLIIKKISVIDENLEE